MTQDGRKGTLENLFTRRQIATLTAVTERILPSDDGPGAKEAAAMEYIAWVFEHPRSRKRLPTYLSGLDLLQSLAQDQYEKDFADCQPEQQDRVLGELEKIPHRIALRFLAGLVKVTLGGFLCEPRYGGNRDHVGWRYLGFERRTAPAEPEPVPARAANLKAGTRRRPLRDVVIIGSGAGGGALALALSRAGLDVLVLEKGPRYRRVDYRHEELLTSERPGFFVPTIEEDPHVLVARNEAAPKPRLSSLGWTASCVGGGTVHMGGYLFRFHPDDFRLRSRFGAFEAIADWPYGYDDLEPYYCRAEWEVGISGEGGANPFEGPRSRPYPMPPLASHPLAESLDRACRRLGLHSFPTPRAINSRPYQGRPACGFCDSCGGYGCPTGARGTSQEALLNRAERTGRCEVRSRAMVREVTTDGAGRASGCIYFDEAGEENQVRARIVCVCCSAVESARLLLLSKSSRFPDGLANYNGLVGRHLQFHTNSTGRARFRSDRHPHLPLGDDNPFLGRSVMDHYFLPEEVASLPKGGLLRFGIAAPDPISAAQRLALEGGRPTWGEPLKRCLREYYQETCEVLFEVFQDFLPNERTYVELDPQVKDRWGLPAARIHLDSPEHHSLVARWLLQRGLEIFAEMGADDLIESSAGGVSEVLIAGTCRAGDDPATSVLDSFCRAHEVPNLYVVDGSFMPTCGGAPPTLTILANGFRTAAHILDRVHGGEL